MSATSTHPTMPEIAAMCDDIRQAFGHSRQEVAFGWRVTYAEENGHVRGVRGDEGVVPNLNNQEERK